MAPRTYDITDGHANIEIIIDGYYGSGGGVGAVGPTGPAGAIGPTGEGYIGPTGDTGLIGPIGPTGPGTGSVGPTGEAGQIGPTGDTGAVGPTGDIGNTGPTGAAGPTGEAGTPGIIGPTGNTGNEGAPGPTGDTGPIGPTGTAENELYNNVNTTPQTLGGIPSGSTFVDQTMQQMWDALLYPYQAPAFSAFIITAQATTIEVGTEVPANPTFSWTETNIANVNPNTTIIKNNGLTIANNISNTSPYVAVDAAVTKLTATSNSWTIEQTNNHGGIFSRSFTVSWRWKVYYGESTNTPLNENQIEALRMGLLQTGFSGTYSFQAGGYKYLCYPASFGTATTFKDTGTNLDVPFDPVYTVSITNVYGITTNYNVHKTVNIIGSAINVQVS